MTYIKFYVKDNVSAQLDGAINAVQTSILFKNGVNFPTVGNWILTIVQFNTDGTILKFEKCLVSSIAGSTLTVSRGYDGTSAQTFANDSYLFLNVDAKIVSDIQDEVTRLETDKLNLSSNPNFFKYQIVTSVNSGNLTVSLKNYLGQDPSVAVPVKVQIGDTIRTITSALSVTLAAGGNWLNLGSSELATKEVDLFTYLYYSTTNTAVGLGFSRYPAGNKSSDFNTANDTSEKSIPRSIPNNTTDSFVNIGRFNAILSAGPGYTWSLGTGPVINYHIFGTKHLFQNVIVGDSTNNATVIINATNYKIDGNFLKITIDCIISNKGSCAGTVRVKAPFSTLGTHTLSGGFKGGLGGIGTPIMYANEIRFTNSTSSWAELQWSSVTNGDRFIVSGSYPI